MHWNEQPPACKIGDFVCAPKACIPMKQRCDGYYHCSNKLDEVDCKKNGKIKITFLFTSLLLFLLVF